MLAQHGDEAVQRLGRGLLVLHHGDADIALARVAAILLRARQIAARNDAQQPRGGPAAAQRQRSREGGDGAATSPGPSRRGYVRNLVVVDLVADYVGCGARRLGSVFRARLPSALVIS